MKVKCWNVHILTLILLIAVSHECTQSQSRENRGKIGESTQKGFGGKDETQKKKSGANKEKETKIKKEISSSEKREQVGKRRLGRNLKRNLRLERILPNETFPKVFPGLDDSHTYTDFISAADKFSACRTSSSCRQELASMGAFADQARCAGGNEFLVKGSCGHEILKNNVTNRFFKDGDSCEPEAFREGSSCRDEGVDCVPRKTECSGFKEFRVVGNCNTDNVWIPAEVEGNICRPYLFRERCPAGGECVFHQRSLGRHRMDNRPTDSAGNLCGEGENAGKPFSFYFDLTLCAKLNSTSQPCPTIQVCVAECPVNYYTFTQGKKDFLRQFCLPTLTDEDWSRKKIMELTHTRKICPSYLVPSTPDKSKGICVPDYKLATPGTEKATNISIIIERIQIVHNVRMLEPHQLLEGAEYILSKAVGETFWENTWKEHLDKSFENRFNDLTRNHG